MSGPFFHLDEMNLNNTRKLANGLLEVQSHNFPKTKFIRNPPLRDALKNQSVRSRTTSSIGGSTTSGLPTVNSGVLAGFALSGGILGKEDKFQKARLARARTIMKGVLLQHIAHPCPNNELIGFWQGEITAKDMKNGMDIQSLQKKRANVYISHNPKTPRSWTTVQRGNSYGYLHASQLYSAVEAIADSSAQCMNKLMQTWYCFHNNASQVKDADCDWKEESVKLAGEFISLSDVCISIMHHAYFCDLRCTYEFALICAHKPFNDVQLGWDQFLSPAALGHLIMSLKHLKVEDLAINSTDNAALIRNEICHRFAGNTPDEKLRAFERFVRYSAIAHVARSCCFLIVNHQDVRRYLVPWWDATEFFGYTDLAETLRKIPYVKWCALGDIGSRTNLRRRVVTAWFEEEVQQLLIRARDVAFVAI